LFHQFNELGMRSLDPRWAGGRPRRIRVEDEVLLIEAATTRPGKLGLPFTHWSLRALVGQRPTTGAGSWASLERAHRLLAVH
jgi:hypothetical protein